MSARQDLTSVEVARVRKPSSLKPHVPYFHPQSYVFPTSLLTADEEFPFFIRPGKSHTNYPRPPPWFGLRVLNVRGALSLGERCAKHR